MMRIAIFGILVTSLCLPISAVADYIFTKTSSQGFLLMDDSGQRILSMSGLSFKHKWQWMGSTPTTTQENSDGANYSYQLENGGIEWDMKFTTKSDTGTLLINNQLRSSISLPLTYISLSIQPETILNNGTMVAIDSNDHETELTFPLRIKELKDVTHIILKDVDQETIATLNFQHPINIHTHEQIRIKLVDQLISPDQTVSNAITLTINKPLQFYSSPDKILNDQNYQTWYPFVPRNTTKNSAFGMQEWLSIPKEPLEIKGNKIFSDNKPYKVWGTNVEFIYNAPRKKEAKKRAAFFAKYGINSVRLHKITNPDWEGLGNHHSASEYDKEKLARFDYWLYQLRKNGITYGLSPIWDLKISEGDKKKLLAYDEIVKARPNKPVTTGLVWFAKDVQDLHIKTLTNLLNHKNPHTKLRYAHDPALIYVEIQNEENSFFYSFLQQVKKHPTYHKLLAKQFSLWLLEKYGSEEALIEHWGQQAINTFKYEGGLPDESLQKLNITPILNPWIYDHHASSGARAHRLQDSATFLFEKQQDYYQRTVSAIRKTGFNGPIVASNWQAGSKGAHFLNLLADANVGIVDRHNYQGGAKGSPGHLMKTGHEFNNYTMLGKPGSGLLSMGMQQVANRPFMSSEWLAVLPSEWAAADTTIVAAYGFGLQGWDMSYHFASNGKEFSPSLGHNNEGKFNNMTPVGIGLYPVLSRMVLRGDITEAAPIGIRRLNKSQAIKNTYDFENTIEQKHDIKSINGTPHHSALAAGKVLIEFTDDLGVSSLSNWTDHFKKENADGSSTIHSSTGELSWTYRDDSDHGFVTINSAGTQGLLGFSQKQHKLNDVEIQSHSPYSVILLSAKSQDKQIHNDKEVILIAMARAHNSNMNLKKELIANIGNAPVILESINATLTFKRKKGRVKVLNHDGKPTGKSYTLKDGKFELNTARDKTPYYLIEFK